MEKKSLWILTEERPKREVVSSILLKFSKDHKIACFIDVIRILPVIEDGRFRFLYEVVGFRCNKIDKIYVRSISGYSSFVDFLVFYQKNQPTQNDTPIYAIEETKTDDRESRNTGVYQRALKFVFVEHYFPGTRKIMLYNLKVLQKEKPTDTYIFGTRLILTLGVEILGKNLDANLYIPFKLIDEIIDLKNRMRHAPKGNVPILLNKTGDRITVSGRLYKSKDLAHDPNIGALSLISAAIRKLGWTGKIIITKHGLNQKNLRIDNKFIKVANKLQVEIEGLKLPVSQMPKMYWKYETEGEKLGTIFIHLVVENFTQGFSIFENHAGCEKGYFIDSGGKYIPLKKYSDRKVYKAGNKKKIISIPDLILVDFERRKIISIEGKKYQFRQNAISELKGFSDIEKCYIKKYYPKYRIIRTVVLYGGTETKIFEIEVGFLLNKNGDLILGIRAPRLFREAIKNLLDFWR